MSTSTPTMTLNDVRRLLAEFVGKNPTLVDEIAEIGVKVVQQTTFPALTVRTVIDSDALDRTDHTVRVEWIGGGEGAAHGPVLLPINEHLASLTTAQADAIRDRTDVSGAEEHLAALVRGDYPTLPWAEPHRFVFALDSDIDFVTHLVCPVCGAVVPKVRDVDAQFTWAYTEWDHQARTWDSGEANGDMESVVTVAECCGAGVCTPDGYELGRW